MSEHTRNVKTLSQLENERYLKQCCKDGLHKWVSSVSPGYEICSREWCYAVRKKEGSKGHEPRMDNREKSSL